MLKHMAYFAPPPGTVYLDDKRAPMQDTWTWVRTIAQMSAHLHDGPVACMSLDYDLSCSDGSNSGADALQWLAANDRWPTETLLIHSGSTLGSRAMCKLVEASGLFGIADEDYPLGPLYRRLP